MYMISKEKQDIMDKELKLVFPDKDHILRKGIIKDSFKNYVLSEMEILRYPALNNEVIRKIIVINGREHLDDALSKGKGVLLFQAHLGAFQMVMPALGYSGYKMSQISASSAIWKDVSKIQNKIFDTKASYENMLPVHHIPIKSSLRPAFRALNKNEIVGITVDGGGGRNVIPIEFLGRIANFQQGGADMALRTGATIIPAFIITEKGLRHRLTLHPPIKVDMGLEKKEVLKEILQQFARILERYVKEFPDHYGYSLYLRSERSILDPYPFFQDQASSNDIIFYSKDKGVEHA